MKFSNTVGKLAAAMAKAQAEMKNPSFDSKNPHFSSRFASLAAVRDAVLPVFAKHGISVSQDLTTTDSGAVACSTVLMHESGEWACYGPLVIPPAKPDAQGRGSAATYAKRYSLQSVAGVVGDEDDDAEGAQGRATGSAKISPLDHGETVTPKQAGYAKEFADGFRKLLAADVEEAEKARSIIALRDEANEDPVVAQESWKLLTAAERRAIKTYISMKVAA